MISRPVRIALIGAGRMGKALATLAPDRQCEVVAMLDVAETNAGITSELLAGADVAIEFTEPSAALQNALRCIAAGCPVVIGTTGWHEQLPQLREAVERHQGRALWSPNFSLGVQLFLAIAEDAGRHLRTAASFEAHIVETHHSAKKDAPSGTAIAIEGSVAKGLGRDHVATTSIRVGHVPGTHEVVFDAPFEQIRLVHEARDRRVFADGALHAARWLAAASTSGVYTMRDVIGSQTSPEQR